MKLSKGFQFTFLAALAWAIAIVTTRIVLQNGENAFNVAFWIAILSTPYWLFILLKNFTEFKKTIRKNYWILLGIGLVSAIGINLVEPFALKYSPAVNFSLLIRSVIVFTIIFAYIFLGEKITVKKIIIAVLILTGSFFLTTKGQSISFSLGDFFTLTEAALIAFGNNILGKIAVKRLSANLSASASFMIGVPVISLIAFSNHAIAIPKTPVLLIILAISSVLLIFFRFRAYQNASASYVTMVFSFTPVMVAFMAIPLLGESMTLVQIIGGILIILGSIAVEKLKI
ncbi:MAG: DMT family transporter [Candidatus Omnitrophota bacterium]|nr:DMT family transporter [Candidatus Omnitrophota bacterium]